MSKFLFRDIVIDSRTGLNPRQNFKHGTGENYYITIKDIHNGRIEITNKTDRIDDDAVAKIKKRSRIKNGDILFTSIGRIGETAIVYDKNDTWEVNESIFIFTLNKEIIDAKYFCMLMQSDELQDKLTKDSSGSTFKSIKMNQLERMTFNIPPLETQRQIAANLDKVTHTIDLCNNILEKLDLLVKSRFVEMFGGLERSTTIARYISELRGGKSLAGTEPCKNKVLKTGAATFGWFDPEQYKYLPTDYEPLPEHKVETGDVIISRMNTPELVGACSYVFDAPEDMYYPDRLWKAVLKENTNPIFLWQLLWDRDIRKAIKESSGGTSGTMHNISKANLLAIKCMDAPIELQNEYAEFVKQTDKSKSAVKKVLEKAETLKKALMQEYFG